MMCPNCHQNEATKDEHYGILPCKICQRLHQNLRSARKPPEFTSDYIRNSRKEYAKDILQSHRKGQLSKEWLDIYGIKAAKRRKFTDKEIANAKPVWNDLVYYNS